MRPKPPDYGTTYRCTRYGVNQTTGQVQSQSLKDDVWYDPAGNSASSCNYVANVRFSDSVRTWRSISAFRLHQKQIVYSNDIFRDGGGDVLSLDGRTRGATRESDGECARALARDAHLRDRP